MASMRSDMHKSNLSSFDVADHLNTQMEMVAYLNACLEESNEASFIAKALGDVAKAKGMVKVANKAGLSRESLYKSLSGDRTPNLETFLKVLHSCDLKISVPTLRDEGTTRR